MKKRGHICFLPEEKSKELEDVMLVVKEQVENYKRAKKAGTLRKISEAGNTRLFNV